MRARIAPRPARTSPESPNAPGSIIVVASLASPPPATLVSPQPRFRFRLALRIAFSRCAVAAAPLVLATAAAVRAQDFPSIRDPGRSSRDDFGGVPIFQRMPVFFPPNPPPLGRAVSAVAAPTGRLVPPPELANYVNEPFYPQLGSRLITKSLNDKLRAQLQHYRTAKQKLQEELQAEIERVKDLDPQARITELSAFARRQTPRVVELEQTADQLRRDLYHRDYAWTAYREWRLADNPRRGYSPLEIAQVMRSYAFYQNGLLPAQRRLLREIAVELQMAAETTEKAAAAQPHIFFPPEPARVLFPDDAPAEVAAKLAAYQTKKAQLKKELYDAIYSHDGERFSFLSGTLRKLVEKQTPRLNELEVLAEDIRKGLAAVPEPERVSERSPLPPSLQRRVSAIVTQLSDAQKEATTKIQDILARSRDVPMQTNHRFDADGLKFVVIASRAGRGSRSGPTLSPEDAARVEAVRNEFTAVANDYGRRLAELVNEKDALAEEIGQALGTTRPDAINQAFSTALRVATARENEAAYRGYWVAVFQPGLSPEQRRLLFDGVIEKLGLPLPRGELQPVQRAATW